MHNRFIELMATGATIITPTQRLSRHLRYQFATAQLALGKQAWETPDCLPWAAWCKRTFESIMLRSNDNVVLLNNVQQSWVWQEIIHASSYKKQLLHVTATANHAMQAYRLCKEWCIPVFPEDAWLSEDAAAFKSWAMAYDDYKQKTHCLDDASLPDYLMSQISILTTASEKIIFYDFEQLTTQQLRLKQALVDAGCEVIMLDANPQNESVSVCEKTDKQSEIRAAATWAKKQLNANPDATIGIVIPNLGALREQLEYGFASVLTPEKWLHNEPSFKKPYSISLGQSLSSYPLIYTALILLALGRRRVSVNDLSHLLHSPFIKSADTELAKRANFDAAIRQQGETQLGFKTLYWMAEERCKPHEQCTEFIQLLKTFEISFLSHAKQQTLRQWTVNFSEWLSDFGWPGERSLTSDEHQIVTAWQKALMQLGSLDGISKPVSFNTALAQLNRLLADTQFQPETAETPIQIIGMTGAAGMQFDYLWVMDMQDDVWPALTMGNGFIPYSVQRDYAVPAASAEMQLMLAKQLTDKLVQSAKEVVLSYANQIGDHTCRPSPLIKPYTETSYVEGGIDQDFKIALFNSCDMESFTDIDAPEIPVGELAHGGSSLFKDQAGCPFKAFVKHRLYAESLQQTDIGLSPAERGNLTHLAMHFLWQRIKTSENLQYRSNAEIEKIIHSVVHEAIKQQVSQQPETFTDKFTSLEQQRLERLLKQWLAIESNRNEFKVIAAEQWQTLLFEDIELHLRVDRIDELADGRCVIIDYKTGTVSKNDWESDNPNDPQLPLYAVTSQQEVAAIAFASLKRGKLGFYGQADGDDILPGVKQDTEFAWQDKLDAWQQVLIRLANDFRQGKATVEPTMTACRYCDLHSLCRIYERIEPFDNEVYEGDAYE